MLLGFFLIQNLTRNPFKEATIAILVQKIHVTLEKEEKEGRSADLPPYRVLTLDGESLRTSSTLLPVSSRVQIEVVEMDENTFGKQQRQQQQLANREDEFAGRVRLFHRSLEEFGESAELKERIRVHVKKHRETLRPYYQVRKSNFNVYHAIQLICLSLSFSFFFLKQTGPPKTRSIGVPIGWTVRLLRLLLQLEFGVGFYFALSAKGRGGRGDVAGGDLL